MKYLLASPLLATAAALATAAPFLSSTDHFAITSCSLGCGSTGPHVSCSMVNVFENQEFRFGFSDEIDPASLNAQSFRVFDTATGTAPAGSLRLDPLDSSVLIYTPETTFNPLGVPAFGFKPYAVYQFNIPGVGANDPGPYVTSVNGLPVWNRLLCSVVPDQGVWDPVPGNPLVFPEVEVVVPHDGTQIITETASARWATQVALDSDITFHFDDLMNVGTLLTPLTGTSLWIRVTRAPLLGGEFVPGWFSYTFDPVEYTTTVVFDPDEGFTPGEIVYVKLTNQCTDLVSNSIASEIFAFRVAGS